MRCKGGNGGLDSKMGCSGVCVHVDMQVMARGAKCFSLQFMSLLPSSSSIVMVALGYGDNSTVDARLK